MDALVIAVVSRPWTSSARWKEIQTDPAGKRARMRAGSNANAVSSGDNPEICWNQMVAIGV